MKKTKRFLTTLIALMLAVGAWAADRVVVAAIQNGTVTASEVAATDSQTVTLTVEPAEGYFITADDIIVSKTARQAQAPRRAPGYADKLGVKAAQVDATGKGIYTFILPEGYGAYVEVGFTERYALTKVTLDVTRFDYDTMEKTVNVVSVMAGDRAVPADSYEVAGNKATGVGLHTVTVTGLGHYKGTATAQFVIAKVGMDIDAEDTETGKEVDDVTMVMKVADNAADKVTTETRIVINPETGVAEEETVLVIHTVITNKGDVPRYAWMKIPYATFRGGDDKYDPATGFSAFKDGRA